VVDIDHAQQMKQLLTPANVKKNYEEVSKLIKLSQLQELFSGSGGIIKTVSGFKL